MNKNKMAIVATLTKKQETLRSGKPIGSPKFSLASFLLEKTLPEITKTTSLKNTRLDLNWNGCIRSEHCYFANLFIIRVPKTFKAESQEQ